jgi:hypothetical protein
VPLKHAKALINNSKKVEYLYEFKSGRQCTYNETPWRVRVTTVGTEKRQCFHLYYWRTYGAVNNVTKVESVSTAHKCLLCITALHMSQSIARSIWTDFPKSPQHQISRNTSSWNLSDTWRRQTDRQTDRQKTKQALFATQASAPKISHPN